MKPQRLEQLTFTRFISAFVILISHFKPIEIVNDEWFIPLFHNFFAVSYFFTLSGFVLGITYYDRFKVFDYKELKNYFVARFARIYPVYLLALLMVIGFDYYITRTIRYSPVNIFLNLTLLQGWFNREIINFPSWSLSCEAFFYVIFPFCVGIIRKWESSKILTNMFILWTLTQLLIYFIFYLLTDVPFYLRFHPLIHSPTFLLGVCTGFYYKRKNIEVENLNRFSNWILLAVIIGELLGKPKFGFESLQVPHYLLFLYFASSNNNFTVKYFKHEFLVLLGKASYGLYLLQGILYKIFDFFYQKYIAVGRSNHDNIKFFTFVLLSVGISIIVYQFYEKPLHKGLSKVLSNT